MQVHTAVPISCKLSSSEIGVQISEQQLQMSADKLKKSFPSNFTKFSNSGTELKLRDNQIIGTQLYTWEVNIFWLMPMEKSMVIQELFGTKNSWYVLTKTNPMYNWRKLSAKKGPHPLYETSSQYTLSNENNEVSDTESIYNAKERILGS